MASFFPGAFASLTSHQPFRWQERLFDRVVQGDVRRRRWSVEKKLQWVAATYEPAATIARVARLYDVVESCLYADRGRDEEQTVSRHLDDHRPRRRSRARRDLQVLVALAAMKPQAPTANSTPSGGLP